MQKDRCNFIHTCPPLAGLSPPPSLFECAPSAPTAMSPPAVLPEPVATPGGSSSSEEEEEGHSKTQLWVQCEHLSCRKWRPLRKDVKVDRERYGLLWLLGFAPYWGSQHQISMVLGLSRRTTWFESSQ